MIAGKNDADVASAARGGTRGGEGEGRGEEEATVFAVQAHRTHGVQLLRVGETIEIELKHKVRDGTFRCRGGLSLP